MSSEVLTTETSVDEHAKGILSTSAILLIRRMVVTVGAAVATGVITRHLTTERFGLYSAALASFYLAQAFCDLGFGSILARELATRSAERPMLLRAALRPAVLWSLIVAIALTAFALLSSDGNRLHVLLVLVPAVAVSGCSVARQWFMVRYDVRRMGGIDLATNLAQVGALIVACLLGAGPFTLALVVSLSVISNAIVVATLALRQSGRAKVESPLVRQLVLMSLPVGIPSILASAYFSIDVVLAGYLVSSAEVARYAAAVKLLTLVAILPSILMSVAMVGFSALEAGGDKHATGELIARSWHWLMAILFPACVSMIFFASFACRLFFGPQYLGSAEPLRVLMVAGALSMLGNLLGTLLIVFRRTTVTMIQTSVVLALNVCLNLAFLPRYGIMSSAWITLGTEVLSVTCALIILRSRVSWGASLTVSRVPLLACAALAGASFIPIGSDLVRAVLAAAAFIVVMTVLRGWPFEPAAILRRLRPHRTAT